MGSTLNHLLFKGIVTMIGFVVAFGFAHTAVFAAINVENRTGSITVTTPDGEVMTFESGDLLPPVLSGSTIEVVTGQADISVTEPDTVDIVINNSIVTVDSGDAIAVAVNPSSGAATMNVLAGSVDALQPDGTTKSVAQGAAFVAPPPAPIVVQDLDVRGADPAGETGRQSSTEQGLVGGY